MKITRRKFVAGSAFAAAGVGIGGLFAARGRSYAGTLLSAFEDARGDQYIGGVALERNEIFSARVPARAHGCAVDPRDPQRVLFFARRPGTQAFELRRDSLTARTAFETGPGRHLAGHGVFSHDGAWLFTPEHDYERVRGVVAVRDARDFSIASEIDTHGIDPHEIAWLPDLQTLLVANGGIMTHPRSFRRKLNIATMDPSLCIFATASAQRLEQHRLHDHLLSIRHLAVAHDGSVVAGLQYEGNPAAAPGIVALYRANRGLQLLTAPPSEAGRFRGYVASVALSERDDLIVAACPYGNGAACWSLHDGRYLGFVTASAEVYGLASIAGSIIASQRDGGAFSIDAVRHTHPLPIESERPIRWDDHWVAMHAS
jgi:uncharacterized protein